MKTAKERSRGCLSMHTILIVQNDCHVVEEEGGKCNLSQLQYFSQANKENACLDVNPFLAMPEHNMYSQKC